MMGKFTGIKCPKCGKKGLRHPNHAHALGWKEYREVACRYCKTRWLTSKIDKYIEYTKEYEQAILEEKE